MKRCPVCLKPFVAFMPWVRYCGRACRERDPLNQKPKPPQLKLPIK